MPEPASGLWRSEDMVLLQIHMAREASYDTVRSLGYLGCAQFRDMNPAVNAFQRLYINEVRRCEDSERRLRFLDEQLKRQQSKRLQFVTIPEDHLPEVTYETLEPKLEGLEAELRESNSKWEQLLQQQNSLREHLEILTQDPTFFRGDEDGTTGGSFREDLAVRAGGLKYLTGVIRSAKAPLFERLIYRATRGNMFMRMNPSAEPFEDPLTGDLVEKTVFVVFFSSQRAYEKIRKLSEVLQASLYPYVIGSPNERETTRKVRADLGDLDMTIKATAVLRSDILQTVHQNIVQWKKVVVVQKSVYNVLNLLSFKEQTAIAQIWAPKDDLNRVRVALSEAERSCGTRVKSFMEPIETRESPPTFFRTNKVTSTHQGIVDAYGVARYKEVNPACFSIVTFPFLFGVMYGDIGHGFLLTVLALLFIIKEKKLLSSNLNEIIAIVFGGRYVLVFMGLFAIYVGFLYNDFFGMMISPFGQPFWAFPQNSREASAVCDPAYVKWYTVTASVTRGCKMRGGTPYPFGVDASWAETENKLEFMNGLKMKLAVILGVTQMIFGLFLQLLNHLHFGDLKHVYYGWVPELIFLSSTFGYMCFMILVKWLVNWPARMLQHNTPPSLLEGMTNFFLSPGDVISNKFLYVNSTFQNVVQLLLLLLAFIAVPLMLIPIPIIEYRHHKHAMSHHSDEEAALLAKPEENSAVEEEPFDMSEVVIKQVIHTIEFVLGCVSNTASYLRLWALSLAHAELSEVFWNFAWMKPLLIDGGSGVVVFIGFAIWAGATVGVLGIMESLSAFLHALRLHWVEFQNKFYYGDGQSFTPYDVNEISMQPFQQSVID